MNVFILTILSIFGLLGWFISLLFYKAIKQYHTQLNECEKTIKSLTKTAEYLLSHNKRK